MVHPSTARALNSRAKRAVPVISRWFDYFRAELNKQRRLERPGGTSKYADEQYPEFIEFKREDIHRLVEDLRKVRRELDEYTSPT